MSTAPTVLSFKEIDSQDLETTGKLAINLAELFRLKIPIPQGFVVSTQAFDQFIEENHLQQQITEILSQLHRNKASEPQKASKQIQHLILSAPLPFSLEQRIIKTYLKLNHHWFSHPMVTIKSQFINFKNEQTAFQQTHLHGETNLILTIKQTWASLFQVSKIHKIKTLYELPYQVPIIVQATIPGEISGKLTTINLINAQKNTIIIEALYGSSELFEYQSETPDHYQINKFTHSIINKQINVQEHKIIPAQYKATRIKVAKHLSNQQKLSDSLILKLSTLGKQIEQYYLEPQEIVWTFFKGKFYIIETHPLTVYTSSNNSHHLPQKTIHSLKPLKTILTGIPTSPGIKTGYPRIIKQSKDLTKFRKGEILVINSPTEKYISAIKKASAIVADEGGQISKLAIHARELGIPCVTGTETATQKLKHKQLITVNGTQGKIYHGAPKISKIDIKPSLKQNSDIDNQIIDYLINQPTKTATQIDCQITNPDNISEISAQPFNGVGRISHDIVFQQFDLHPEHLTEQNKQHQISDLLTDLITKVCQSFSHRPVISHFSNLSTWDLRQLHWGKQYETEERNPLLGHRGTLKHLNQQHLIDIEIKAIKKALHKNNLKNLQIALSLIRSAKELIEMKKLLTASGLARTSSFKLWLTISTPANIIQLSDFQQIGIDGIIIDLDHLTQLLIGIDFHNSELQHLVSENYLTTEWALTKIIKTAHQFKLPISIYAKELENKTQIIEKLINLGITRITISPNAATSVRNLVSHAEKRLAISKNKL